MEIKYIITAIALFCMVTVVISMIIFSYLANKYQSHQLQKFEKRLEEQSPYRNSKKYKKPNKPDEMKTRDKEKEVEKEREINMGLARYNPNLEHDAPQMAHDNSTSLAQSEQKEVVGLAKPLGFWTKFVTKQKVGFMIAMGGLQNEQKGSSTYWRNYIKAQAASQGKEQGKGR